jgi:hypothetical protein
VNGAAHTLIPNKQEIIRKSLALIETRKNVFLILALRNVSDYSIKERLIEPRMAL